MLVLTDVADACGDETPNQELGLPPKDAPCDDPRRHELGERWHATVAEAVARFDSCRALDDPRATSFAALGLMPEYAARYVFERYIWPDAIYDPDVLLPERALLERAETPALRVMALASMAASARAFDWASACSLATRAYSLLDSLFVHADTGDSLAVSAIDQAWSVVDFMESSLTGELSAHQAHVGRALESYRNANGEPPHDVLVDGERLWEALRPFVREAVAQSEGRGCRDPAGADLRTNRFLTDPGLRIELVTVTTRRADSPAVPEERRLAPALRLYRTRRGDVTILDSRQLTATLAPRTPRAVVHNYVLAHGRRDVSLLAETLHADFRNYTSAHDDDTTSRAAELESMAGVFDAMQWIELLVHHGIPRPSEHPDFPRTDGYWEVRAKSCRYTFLPLGADEPERALQENVAFILTAEDSSIEPPAAGSKERWSIVALADG